MEELSYTKHQPWNGLGIYLGNSIGLTTKMAMEKNPQIGSSINAQPVLAKLPNGLFSEVAGQYAMVREYDNKVVGIVGEQFKKSALQPRKMFEFFDGVLEEGRARIHSAGTLDNGRRVWIMVKLTGDDIWVDGKTEIDVIEKYILLCTAFDGSMPLTTFFVPYRPSSRTTLNGALQGEKYNQIKIRHTANAKSNFAEAESTLTQSIEFYSKFEEKVSLLANRSMDRDQINLALRRMFSVSDDAKLNDIPTRTANNMDKIKQLMNNAHNRPWLNTAWGLYNAACEYGDYHMIVRGARDSKGRINEDEDTLDIKDKILNSIWFGASASFKAQVMKSIDSIISK